MVDVKKKKIAEIKNEVSKLRSTKLSLLLIMEMVEECVAKFMNRGEIKRYLEKQPVIKTAEEKILLDSLPQEEKAARVLKMPKIQLSTRQVDRYIEKVRKKWEKDGVPGKNEMRRTIMYTLRLILSRSIMTQDYRTAIMAIERYSKMFGLDEAAKLDVNADIKAKMEGKLSIDDLRESYQKGKEGEK